MNFILLYLYIIYIIIIFAWFIAVHQSHTMYTSLAQRKSQSKEKNNKETNKNMHSNSTRAKFVKKNTMFYEKISKKKYKR